MRSAGISLDLSIAVSRNIASGPGFALSRSAISRERFAPSASKTGSPTSDGAEGITATSDIATEPIFWNMA